MSNLSTLPKGDSAWLLRKAIERIIQQVSVLETNIGASTSGNSANTQIIFNDNGTLRGDAGLVYNKTTDALTVAGLVTAGSATITGDLTVRTNKLIVNANGVGAGKTPLYPLDVGGNISMTGAGTGSRFLALLDETNTYAGSLILQAGGGSLGYGGAIQMYGHSHATYPGSVWIGSSAGSSGPIMFGRNGTTPGNLFLQLDTGGVCTWYDGAGGTRMTLNSTGLGVGASPAHKLQAVGGYVASGSLGSASSGDIGGLLIYCSTDNGGRRSWGLKAESGTTGVLGFWLSSANNTEPFSGTQVMSLDSSGNLGIGVTPSAWRTSVPFKALQIGYTGAVYALGATEQVNLSSNYLQDTAGNEVRIQAGYATKYQQSSGQHLWSTAASSTAGSGITFTPAMTLDTSGNLLVGTTSLVGTERLIVTKTTVGSVLARFVNTNTTVDTYGIAVSYSASTPNDASHYFLGCFDSTTSRAQIYANGGLANYSANNVNLSDARTKTDIKPLTSYWNKIKALELVTFKYKDQTHDDDNIGLISQQVESVAPEFVSNEGFGETPADGVPLKSIYTTDLYHAAIKALQEAMTRIEVLESKLA